MKSIIAAALLIALWLSLALTGTAYASNILDDKIIFGDNFTLLAGETIDGDLVVFGGNVAIEDGATVTGSLVVFGGNVDVAGAVNGDVTIFGGNASLRSTAVVNGELNTIGGSTSREEGARILGGESQGFEFGQDRTTPAVPDRFRVFRPIVRFYSSVFNVVFSALSFGLLALLVVLFWPDQTARVSAAVTNAPGAAGGLGVLTAIAVPVLILVTGLTICLLPFSFIGALVLAAAAIFGWIALGMIVGARLSAALRWHNLSPAVSAAIGTFLFSLAASAISALVPCVGWIIPAVLGSVGLGAVALTRFGTQPYVPIQPLPTASPGAGGTPLAP